MAERADSAAVGLRPVFGNEVAARLPRLQAALDGCADDLDQVRRDAHSLGTSGYVVGEPEIAALARAVEDDLANGPLAELVARLQVWTP